MHSAWGRKKVTGNSIYTHIKSRLVWQDKNVEQFSVNSSVTLTPTHSDSLLVLPSLPPSGYIQYSSIKKKIKKNVLLGISSKGSVSCVCVRVSTEEMCVVSEQQVNVCGRKSGQLIDLHRK